MKSSYTYNFGINFVRAVAILGVVFYHAFPATVRGGYLGVCFFFLASGYLVAQKTRCEDDTRGFDARDFYRKKGKRLFLPLYGMVVTVLAYMTLFAVDFMTGMRQETAGILLGYNNWWQLLHQASYFQKIATHSPFTHMWYLGVEVQLLLLWPLFHRLYKGLQKVCKKQGVDEKRADLLFLVLAIASAAEMAVLYATAGINRVYYGTDTRAFAFFFGVYLGCRESDWAKKCRIRKNSFLSDVLLFLTLLAVIVLFFAMPGESAVVYIGGMAVVCLLFGWLIFLLKTGFYSELPSAQMPRACSRWDKVIHNPACQWIGRHSYAIYLWHYPVLFFLIYYL